MDLLEGLEKKTSSPQDRQHERKILNNTNFTLYLVALFDII
jgi:hypothetical protein